MEAFLDMRIQRLLNFSPNSRMEGNRVATQEMIDGSAPPFILFALVMASFVYSTTLYYAPKLFGGLRKSFYEMLLVVQILLFTEGCMILYRIVLNNGLEKFTVLDRWIMAGLWLLLPLKLIIGLLLKANVTYYAFDE